MEKLIGMVLIVALVILTGNTLNMISKTHTVVNAMVVSMVK